MRAFIAVEVPDANPAATAEAAPEHLTLLFLGEVPADRVDSLTSALAPVGRATRPFDVTLQGVGAFPSRERPRVVWVGARDGSSELVELARRVRAALPNDAGLSTREEFVPHLTLFRVRSPADRRHAAQLLSGAMPVPGPRRFAVREFVLKESVLSSRGATHRTLARFPLEGEA